MATTQAGTALAEREQFPWDRLDEEPFAAYSAFVEYRSMDPKTRSHRKLSVSATLAAHWSSRFRWVKRACAYDTWQLDLGERTARDAVLHRKSKLVSFAFASLDKALDAVKRVEPKDVESIVALAEAGAALSGKALGIAESEGPSQTVGLQVNVGSPLTWQSRQQTELNTNQTVINQNDNKEVVVLPQEKVLDGTKRASVHRPLHRPLPGTDKSGAGPLPRLSERVVNSPSPVDGGGSSAGRRPDKRGGGA